MRGAVAAGLRTVVAECTDEEAAEPRKVDGESEIKAISFLCFCTLYRAVMYTKVLLLKATPAHEGKTKGDGRGRGKRTRFVRCRTGAVDKGLMCDDFVS